MVDITIRCACSTSFNIAEKNLRESIVCPNCNKPLDETQLHALKEGVSKLSLVKQLSTNQPQQDKTPFKFAVTYDFTD